MSEPNPMSDKYHFAKVTLYDREGLIYIAAFLTFTYAHITFITRCFIKWHIPGLDDWAMLVAQVRSTLRHRTEESKIFTATTTTRNVSLTPLTYLCPVHNCNGAGLAQGTPSLSMLSHLFPHQYPPQVIILGDSG